MEGYEEGNRQLTLMGVKAEITERVRMTGLAQNERYAKMK